LVKAVDVANVVLLTTEVATDTMGRF